MRLIPGTFCEFTRSMREETDDDADDDDDGDDGDDDDDDDDDDDRFAKTGSGQESAASWPGQARTKRC